jgi:NADH:ubiquinone oxidoreductase subunit C
VTASSFLFVHKGTNFIKNILHSVHLDSGLVQDTAEYLGYLGNSLITGTGIDLFTKDHRFALVYTLAEYTKPETVYLTKKTALKAESLADVFASAIWLEREIYDLFGVIFSSQSGNTDLRRILTDYNFRGHPLRKDFGGPGYKGSNYGPSGKQILTTIILMLQCS